MPSTQDLYKQLTQVQNQQQAMGPVNAGDVYNQLASKVDFFRPQYNELRTNEAQAYAMPTQMMQDYNNAYGTEAGAGQGALSRLNSILQAVGQQNATTGVMRDVINTQGGNLQSISKNILDQYNAQKSALDTQYNQLFAQYQQKAAEDEAAKQRAAAAASAAQQQALLDNIYRQATSGTTSANPTQTMTEQQPVASTVNLNEMPGYVTGTDTGSNLLRKLAQGPTSLPYYGILAAQSGLPAAANEWWKNFQNNLLGR